MLSFIMLLSNERMDLLSNKLVPQIGDVYLIKFNGDDSEQRGWRPGLVFQNNIGNVHSPNVIAIPFTSSLKKLNQPTHVLVSSVDSGLRVDSVALCENPECVSKEKLGAYITTLSPSYMSKIAEASILATSAISFLSPQRLLRLWEQANIMNA